MKVVVTAVSGLLLGALVPVVLAIIHATRTAPSGMDFIVPWSVACVGLALVSLYASSLTHHLLQALGSAFGIMLVSLFLGNWFGGSFSRGYFVLFDAVLWSGPLGFIVGASVMLSGAIVLTWQRLWRVWISLLGLVTLAFFGGKVYPLLAGGLATDSYNGFTTIKAAGYAAGLCPVALAMALAAGNFKHTQPSLSLWKRNAAMWLGSLLLTGVLTAPVYNRAWELAMRFEPPAGPPRLTGSVQPVIAGWDLHGPTFVLLPDGRLCSYKQYERIPPAGKATGSGQTADSEPAWRMISNPQVEFIGGSNWVEIASTSREFAGVKSDGSLWRACWLEAVDKNGNITLYGSVRGVALRVERFGDDSDWAQVVAGGLHFAALKKDGTLWGWGDNKNHQLGEGPTFVPNPAVQIGQSSNWVAVYAGYGHSYAVNRAGEIWRWGRFQTDTDPFHPKTEEGPVKLNIKVPGVRSITQGPNSDLVLDTDGNLWGLGRIPPALTGAGFGNHYFAEPIRLGSGNWVSVNCNWEALLGLKSDGTLWSQRSRRGLDFYNGPLPKLAQLGKRRDWIAVMADWEADLALARDGTICRFGEPTLRDYRDEQLLAPTRRVTWSMNLLDAAK